MRYSEEIIEEIRSRTDIVQIISGYVHLQRKGSAYFGICPFHNEKSPSFSVNRDRQMYHCFGCGVSGNVYTFLMSYERYTFVEAVRELAQRAGIDLPEVDVSEESKSRAERRETLLKVQKEAATFFYYGLRQEIGKHALDYLKNRGLSMETINGFGLGFAPKDGGALINHLRGRGFSDDIIKDAGLSKTDERHGARAMFWNRVMFPIQDLRGRVIAFGGRVMGDYEPKYLNSPETDIFDKGRNLYGINRSKSGRGGLILCEGYMDVIAMHQAGFTKAIACLGTAFTYGQAALIKRHSDEVFLAYDSDGAGVNATLRALPILRSSGVTGRVVTLTPYKDPDEFVKALGGDELSKRLDEAENAFMFEIRMAMRKYDINDPAGKTAFHREIAKKLTAFSEEMERENYLEAVSVKYGIETARLRNMVAKQALMDDTAIRAKGEDYADTQKQASERKSPKESAREKAVAEPQRLLISWLCEEPALYKYVNSYIKAEDFITDTYRKVAEILFLQIEQNAVNPAQIISMFEGEGEQTAVANAFFGGLRDVTEREKAFADILRAVKRNSYDRLTKTLGTDIQSIQKALEEKKVLEELNKLHIPVSK